jgi:DNA-binding response OmpR family regulator
MAVHQRQLIGPGTSNEHLRKTAPRRPPLRETAGVSAPTVLLVEDEPDIVALLNDFLAVEGFGVVAAADAPEAIAALDRIGIDCVVLDVMLPGASGFDVCRSIRERSDVPLLFLSARGEDGDKLRGLALGADDYIVKSATPAEVVARVKAVLRRAANGRSTSRRSYGRIEVDLAAHETLVDGEPVGLTAREFELLTLFITHPRQVLTREQIFEQVWGSWGDRSAVSVYVRRLRDKLEADARHPELLVTVWGVGYRFDPPAMR